MNNKILIIYKSSTGFTKKYAELVSGEINCTLVTYETVTPEIISKYNIIVFGSRAHAGMIDGYKKIKKLISKNPPARFILFVTGATPASSKDTIEAFWKQNLSPDEISKIPHFYMPGGLCYEKMSLSDRLMMKTAAFIVKNKKNKTTFDNEFENAIKSSYDISSPEYIKPMVLFLKNII